MENQVEVIIPETYDDAEMRGVVVDRVTVKRAVDNRKVMMVKVEIQQVGDRKLDRTHFEWADDKDVKYI